MLQVIRFFGPVSVTNLLLNLYAFFRRAMVFKSSQLYCLLGLVRYSHVSQSDAILVHQNVLSRTSVVCVMSLQRRLMHPGLTGSCRYGSRFLGLRVIKILRITCITGIEYCNLRGMLKAAAHKFIH